MGTLIGVVLPVFLVIGFGFAAARFGKISEGAVDGLMRFAQNFALPCLLFRAISDLDLQAGFNLPLLASFYAGALAGFVVGIAGARILFRRPWEDAVAIGFLGMFSNSLLLGLPITEQAYGTGALTGNFAIISVHSPFCYAVGITVMEVVRNRGQSKRLLALHVLQGMASNALIIGIACGLVVNLTGVPVPTVLSEAVDLMARAGLPAALFALGGILMRYKPEGDILTICFACSLSLLLHPLITYGLGRSFGLDVDGLRSATVTAAMAPGVNTYIFANMYGVAKRVAASSVLLGTALCVLTAWFWLSVLP
ncbi:AEC family transporter [Roseicyclus sp. F158]|uniref:AEC family transporter n=1 Tax=Tropicimonas omnivorans TaxID=3075590 RepID=A0ABU3DKM3_9RHOB|nr:AEC family transporter [Roseicyclus sp. F158]MDT0684264.1 AEC family transporter [Roseicyclus sp. F158]